ncbi:Rrf2 family transcriptional regulator [Aestuariivirga sp.]|uniref:RrF2 family transcriptional regulator n=1 Tax=Aestuariivirga sp. TaxID=2650926 RepID=UPI0025BB1609|nr:Rrf2 family transcriptional regulator [Aestuariivirga sp.]MCA3555846.1 Rrf2 family transcriptional regulator [Aestuariivirga sp.]
MLSSSRFIVAVHAMSVLARFQGKGPVCSAAVAESVHTNPVVIRRLMGELERAHLVKSVAGRAGGFELSKDPAGITLADVYFAVEDENVFRMHKTDPRSCCPVAAQLGKVLSGPLRAAECALHSSLARTSIRDVALAIV